MSDLKLCNISGLLEPSLETTSLCIEADRLTLWRKENATQAEFKGSYPSFSESKRKEAVETSGGAEKKDSHGDCLPHTPLSMDLCSFTRAHLPLAPTVQLPGKLSSAPPSLHVPKPWSLFPGDRIQLTALVVVKAKGTCLCLGDIPEPHHQDLLRMFQNHSIRTF
jgi:hypothetical protein